MGEQILIAEDDADINNLLAKILRTEHFKPIQAFSGTEAKLLFMHNTPDLILLDLMLPGLSGEELLSELRENLSSDVPVIILSAKIALADKVSLLKMGADDYITKPVEPEEVIARIQAALRRTATSKKLSCLNLELYPDSRKVTVHGIELSLTAHEYDLLYLFIKNPEKVYSREMLYDLVWHGGYYGENNTVNVHVSNLRKKIKEADPENEYIRTVYGIGFKLVLHSNKTKFEAVI